MRPRRSRASLVAGALVLGALTGCAAVRPDARPAGGDTRSFVLRLRPGQELHSELARLAAEQHLEAASVVSVVGSLTDVSLRYANRPETTRLTGHFEVVALSGYLAAGEFHLHMAVSDGEGRTLGGHVMDGNVVYTTLVVVVEEHLRYRYRRVRDAATGRDELVIESR